MYRQHSFSCPLRATAADAGYPARADVHVRIWLNGVAFDYRAAATAIHNVILDWQRKRWCAIEIIEHTLEDMLPETRLPNERLFIGP
ncbi:hypothetical protein AB0L57_14645 [Nocardia sp. NPDC052254]|uniref:hypothetical protein n=1 Tax=Nocardia sp. NPDC052254 TaxID=3155681 RepID=UPI0034451A0F